VGGQALIEYHLKRLELIGVSEVIINVSYLAEKIIEFLGSGERYGLTIQYSIEDEGPLGPLGGIRQARALLGNKPFLLFSADIFFNGSLPEALLTDDGCSHLVLAEKSKLAHFFSLEADQFLSNVGELKDYAGIARLRPEHLDYPVKTFVELIDTLRVQKKIRGSLLKGDWFNLGTPAHLIELDAYLKGSQV
jgi:MurNAc alpha-1-phosphate uridylyltransferase